MMKKRMFKVASGLLVLALAFGLTACAGDDGGVGMGTPMEGFQPGDQFFSEEPLKISLLFREDVENPWRDDWLMIELLRDLTNVDITHETVVVPPDDLGPQRQLLIGAGTEPYIMPFIWGQHVPPLVQAGAILPVSEYWHHMPNFLYFVDKWDLWDDLEQQRQPSGNIYFLPGLLEDTRVRFSVALREDILEELGLAVPDTWYEIRDTLRAVKAEFPDTTPYQEAWGSYATFNIAARTFGVRFGWGLGTGLVLDHDTQEYVHIGQKQALRDFTEFWASLVDEGLMAGESMAYGFDGWEQFVNGNSIMVGTSGAEMQTTLENDIAALQEAGLFEGPFARENPRILTLPIPNGPTGFIGEQRIDNGMVLSNRITEREDYVAVLQFIDWLWFSEAGREFSMWGVEGETFEWVDGERRLMDGFVSRNFGRGGNLESLGEWRDLRDEGFSEPAISFTHGGSRELLTSILTPEGVELHTERRSHLPNPEPPFNVEEAEVYGMLATQLAEQTDAALRGFMIGFQELNDETWNAFVQSLYDNGLQRLVDAATVAHRRERLGQ